MRWGRTNFGRGGFSETDYRSFLDVPSDVRGMLPVSFDVIGDVAIIRLDRELTSWSSKIGDAMIRANPRLRTVAMDKGVKGELRVRDIEVVSGDPVTETEHIEYGLRLMVDPSKTYFNPRLAGERRRIASLVRPGERVTDMFAGVGPFSLMISKYAVPSVIFAIDLNHDAIELMKRNIELNKAKNIIPLEGDSRRLIREILVRTAR